MRNELVELAASVWAMEPEKLEGLVAMLKMRTSGVALELTDVAAKAPRREGQIAVLPLEGVLTPRPSFWGGGTSLRGWRRELAELVADPSIDGIVLAVDSPGGSAALVEETADDVYRARQVKPVVAHVEYGASGAYWIGSQAHRMVVTPSGDVGSIGVYSMHVDTSKMMEDWGFKVTLISAGKYKVEGNSFEPLADSAREAMQERVDGIYQRFLGAVARGRGVSTKVARTDFGEGRLVEARKAVDAGMADAVGDLGAAIAEVVRLVPTARLSSLAEGAGPAGAGGEDGDAVAAGELELLQLRHELYRRTG